jgi:hypothetical protein
MKINCGSYTDKLTGSHKGGGDRLAVDLTRLVAAPQALSDGLCESSWSESEAAASVGSTL